MGSGNPTKKDLKDEITDDKKDDILLGRDFLLAFIITTATIIYFRIINNLGKIFLGLYICQMGILIFIRIRYRFILAGYDILIDLIISIYNGICYMLKAIGRAIETIGRFIFGDSFDDILESIKITFILLYNFCAFLAFVASVIDSFRGKGRIIEVEFINLDLPKLQNRPIQAYQPEMADEKNKNKCLISPEKTNNQVE